MLIPTHIGEVAVEMIGYGEEKYCVREFVNRIGVPELLE